MYSAAMWINKCWRHNSFCIQSIILRISMQQFETARDYLHILASL
jgi:hypothetical protein